MENSPCLIGDSSWDSGWFSCWWLPTTSYPIIIIIIIVTNQPSNHHYSQPAIDSPLGPPKKEAVLAVLWVGSWVFFASCCRKCPKITRPQPLSQSHGESHGFTRKIDSGKPQDLGKSDGKTSEDFPQEIPFIVVFPCFSMFSPSVICPIHR